MEDLSPRFEACNAHLLRGVIEATTPPGETAAEARARADSIAEMFRDFDPRGAMASMIACHCIALRFVMMAALRDLSAAPADLDPKVQARMRATAVSLSKSLHMWMAQYESVKTRGAEDKTAPAVPSHPRAAPPVQPAPPASAPSRPPSPRPTPGPSAPAMPVAARTIPIMPPAPMTAMPFTQANRPDVSLREAMLASTTLSHGNGQEHSAKSRDF